MRDKKYLPLIFLPVMIVVIVANSDMHTDGKSVIFALSALCMLIGGYLSAKPYIKRRKEKA